MSQAGIIDFIGTHPEIPILFVADVGSAVPIANTIELLGDVVAAHGVPLQTVGSGNTVNFNVQYASAAATSIPGNAGVASFSSTDFSVDANGFVTITAIAGATQMGVDASTAPGTDPVVPDGGGVITVTGGQVAAGTTANVIQTNSLAANTYTIQIQRSSAQAASTIGANGVSHFNSAFFTVDANGFVSVSGTGIGQTITGQSGGPLSPTAGNWNIFGASVVAGTSPVATSGAGSTLTVNVQTAQAIASTNATNIGLAAFNSTYFTVDANGFVSINGAAVAQTITGDVGGPLSPTAGNWNILGTSTAAGTTPVQTSGAGSTLTVQVQKSQAIAATNANNVGVAAFDSASFTVDPNGFVSLVGGSSPALLTLSDDVNTIINPSVTGNIQLVGHVNEQGATKFSTIVAGTNLANINPMSSSRWIVDALGFNGTHTTIASAIASATSGDTIFVLPGTYTENLTLKVGVNITAYPGDEFLPNVTIIGKCSFSATGTTNISNIRLQTNGDFFLEVTGSNIPVVNLYNCYVNCTNNTGISFTASNAASLITMTLCNGDITTTGITVFSFSGTGIISMRRCNITNSGGTTTNSTCSSGSLEFLWCNINFPITVSSVGVITSRYCSHSVATTIPLTLTNSPSNNSFSHCAIGGATNSSLSIGSGCVTGLFNTNINSSNANAITGGGTLIAPSVTFTGNSFANNVTTIAPLPFGLTKTFLPNLAFGGASVGITYTTQLGKYWLIGSMVFFDINIVLSNKGSSVGNASITNLPFTSANDGHQMTCPVQSNITFPAGCTALVGAVAGNSTSVSIQGYGTGAIVIATNTQFANTSVLVMSGFYWTQ